MFKFEWTKKHTTILIYTCVTMLLAIAIAFAILFPSELFKMVGGVLGALSPAFFGFVIAYLLHPVCDFFDNTAFGRITAKNQKAKKTVHVLSVVCTFLAAVAVIALFIGILVPQVAKSYMMLESKLSGYIASASRWINGVVADLRARDKYGLLSSLLGSGNITSSLGSITSSIVGFVGNVADKVLEYSSAALSVVSKVVVSIIFAVYFLIEKETLFVWTAKLSDKIFPMKFNSSARYWISYTDTVFSSFIMGKLLDALFITLINFVVFGLCDIPYYPLIALITGVTDMIPYFGPFIGAIPCAFIILIAEPVKVIWFIALVLVIQQIDGNIVGPKILGEKVGADSLLVIVAITVGGGLFGIAGMFVSVPVFTIIYHAINVFLASRLRKKGLPTDTASYEKSREEAAK